ncbi:bifunctional N-glycosylase/AP lyase NTG1 SKDI_01G0580 [Saccharomyces kudriavzevii IFO 1802]|uniref:Endonuclease III homolog n=1 Tax=Saccharomyces kudriavzevii (strain ATCC MYA-4449 / AS 2.2408 / CBS 8840 / NBRC 1802 / NCYC 2889) TaxID=226230 RepID=A0AA35NPN9_SACK1|nr:uncharacterized protein SKDI_01G0580 [Saccharomyces kudriavzevii IFO 1802]CAI4054556.1 hypothetical protein SKDI_01G0580 [Saccharomyces kudriavzevii IFO 1802]
MQKICKPSSMAILRKRPLVKTETGSQSEFFAEKRTKIKQEEVVPQPVDIDWVKSLPNEKYFEWIVVRNGNVPDRWSKPLDSSILLTPASTKVPYKFQETYARMRVLRSKILAPVDIVGGSSIPVTIASKCGLSKELISPRDYRLQVLLGVMLSSQTKDEVTAMAMYNIMRYCMDELHVEQGMTLEAVLQISESKLDELIHSVGFHTRKAKYVLSTCQILQDRHLGDVPATINELLALPGVGPKMAYLTLQKAWGKIEGICVDVHVDRLTKIWKWVDPQKCKNPDQTRIQLQNWLPRGLWTEINGLLVGFGQIITKSRNVSDLSKFLPPSDPRNSLDWDLQSQLYKEIQQNIMSYPKWVKYLEGNPELDVGVASDDEHEGETDKETLVKLEDDIPVKVED